MEINSSVQDQKFNFETREELFSAFVAAKLPEMKDRYCIEYISEGSVIIAQPQIRLLLNSFLSNCASLASKRSRICLSRFSTAILRSSSILPRRRNKFVEVRVCIVSAR